MSIYSKKKHHYLPTFYLKYFCKNGEVCFFDKKNSVYRNQPPKKAFKKDNYNTFISEDGTRNLTVENALAEIEDKTKPIIEKVENRKPISVKEKEDLSVFVGLFKTRVPKFRKFVGEIYKVIEKDLSLRKENEVIFSRKESDGEEVKATSKDVLSILQGEINKKNLSLEQMLSLVLKIAGQIKQMNWLFLCSPKQTSFVTTDNPFTLIYPPNCKDNFPGEVGIITKGARKIIPISQKTCLMIYDKGAITEYRNVTKKQVRIINVNVAKNCDRYVIGRDKNIIRNIVERIGLNKKLEKGG
ncbi:DUF4238 domain-containing protein [Candidatus Pacearchaeota archaeon]|nr:DUF4238 domain-containing protein [Candidatus Pacearchaeota archaeon]